MIVQTNLNTIHSTQPRCHDAFLSMLGDIRRHARHTLRRMPAEARDATGEFVSATGARRCRSRLSAQTTLTPERSWKVR